MTIVRKRGIDMPFSMEDQRDFLRRALEKLKERFDSAAKGGDHWVYAIVADRGLCLTVEALRATSDNMRVAIFASDPNDAAARNDADELADSALKRERPELSRLEQTSTAAGRAFGYVWSQRWPVPRELTRAFECVEWWMATLEVEAIKHGFRIKWAPRQ